MAEVRRTRDHSIWFNSRNYRQQSHEVLLESLYALNGGEQTALVFNGVQGVWERFAGFISAIGVPVPSVLASIMQVSSALLADPELVCADGKLMKGGKLFDDVIDSVNCLFTAIAFCRNASHLWLGADPEDGQIVGPGR